MKHFLDWAEETGEGDDTLRAIRRIPARLGMLDADLGSLPDDMLFFERNVAGVGYSVSTRTKDAHDKGRREDSRIRAALRRYNRASGALAPVDNAVRARYDALIEIIAAEEDLPGSGARWNIGRHRSITVLRARAECAPEALTQVEIDRIGREMSADKRRSLRKVVNFLNSLRGLLNELPALREFLPAAVLAPPAGSARGRKIHWEQLPEAFRASFEAVANACLAGDDDLAERLLARIEAGEDPETVMAEADAQSAAAGRNVGKPTSARRGYREAVSWLVRAWEDAGGDRDDLMDVRELFEKATIEGAIKSQIARSTAADDLKDPMESTTLKTRLASLTTLARHGLDDAKATAVIKLLRTIHYDTPRKKLKNSKGGRIQMEVDGIAEQLRQQPHLAAVWTNAPARIADHARRKLAVARSEKNQAHELTALREFAGAAAYAIQLSRPLRPVCLRQTRIAKQGDAHANLLRAAPGDSTIEFRFAPWEIKNDVWVNVEIVGQDAAILKEWFEVWRPRMIELRGLSKDNPYLFPGDAEPKRDETDPVALPHGCYSTSSFLELWRDASKCLGVHVTPHRMRHVVALLCLALRPGDYAFVSSVLGNSAAVAEEHYGRDNGQEAAKVSRAAMLAAHPDLFKHLRRRTKHAR